VANISSPTTTTINQKAAAAFKVLSAIFRGEYFARRAAGIANGVCSWVLILRSSLKDLANELAHYIGSR
jgi:phage-related protein